mmetsp:Transcript_20434/g.70561  ORF Transcript_20434/g.70561 Transcript_20434/m.70561 type:complete len:250 (+) Transcript_20434:411-1160(+)
MWTTVGDSDDDALDGGDAPKKRDGDSKDDKKDSKDDKARKAAKKEKKEKKKKSKKKSKKEKKKKSKNPGAIDQDQWGKHGVLREADYFRKTREFELWLNDVKRIPSFSGSKRELMELFLSYAEDYNTVTLPHEKYIDLDKWEVEERDRAARGEKKRKKGTVQTEFNDEDEVRAQRRKIRDAAEEKAEAEEIRRAAQKLEKQQGKVEFLREQEQLKEERAQAYKRGDLEKVKQLEKKLNPNNDDYFEDEY